MVEENRGQGVIDTEGGGDTYLEPLVPPSTHLLVALSKHINVKINNMSCTIARVRCDYVPIPPRWALDCFSAMHSQRPGGYCR